MTLKVTPKTYLGHFFVNVLELKTKELLRSGLGTSAVQGDSLIVYAVAATFDEIDQKLSRMPTVADLPWNPGSGR